MVKIVDDFNGHEGKQFDDFYAAYSNLQGLKRYHSSLNGTFRMTIVPSTAQWFFNHQSNQFEWSEECPASDWQAAQERDDEN